MAAVISSTKQRTQAKMLYQLQRLRRNLGGTSFPAFQIAAHADLSTPQGTAALVLLEQKGLVERHHLAKRTTYRATDAGMEAIIR